MASTPINPTQPPGISVPPQTVVIEAGVIPWQVETVPMPAAGASSVSYSLLKTPQTGALVFWGWDDGTAGFFLFTGNPIIFQLPEDWESTDVLRVAYQGQ